ncbi:hypothetical protein KM043_000062, partial [Ampulex compressa]
EEKEEKEIEERPEGLRKGDRNGDSVHLPGVLSRQRERRRAKTHLTLP